MFAIYRNLPGSTCNDETHILSRLDVSVALGIRFQVKKLKIEFGEKRLDTNLGPKYTAFAGHVAI
jgi:hypothetical protein